MQKAHRRKIPKKKTIARRPNMTEENLDQFDENHNAQRRAREHVTDIQLNLRNFDTKSPTNKTMAEPECIQGHHQKPRIKPQKASH
jgi:hypothetical protein